MKLQKNLAEMGLAVLDQYDERATGSLRTAGHILKSCDSLAKDRLLRAEVIGTVRLNGRSNDSNHNGLTEDEEIRVRHVRYRKRLGQ